MSSDNFEKQIKAKLEARSIQPTENAWERLSLQLDEKPQDKPSQKKYWYYGVAASVIGLFIAVGILMSGADNAVHNSERLVETPSQNIENELESTPLNSKVAEYNEKQDILPVVNEARDFRIAKVESKVKSPTDDPKQAEQTPAELEMSTALIDSLIYINSADQLLAEIEGLIDNPDLSSDAEIEQLLLQAHMRLAVQDSKPYDAYAVDADALLRDVENDIDMSFRERVLESLISHYRMLKTAVADRRN